MQKKYFQIIKYWSEDSPERRKKPRGTIENIMIVHPVRPCTLWNIAVLAGGDSCRRIGEEMRVLRSVVDWMLLARSTMLNKNPLLFCDVRLNPHEARHYRGTNNFVTTCGMVTDNFEISNWQKISEISCPLNNSWIKSSQNV